MEIQNIILYFFIYGFLGWCTEVAYAAVKERKFVNRGFLNGPICPIYGVGVVIVVQLLDPYAHQLGLLYLLSVVLTTGVADRICAGQIISSQMVGLLGSSI